MATRRDSEDLTHLQQLLEERSGMEIRALIGRSISEGGSARGAEKWIREKYQVGPTHLIINRWLREFGGRVLKVVIWPQNTAERNGRE